MVLTAVTLKSLSTRTSSSVPSDLRTCALYGEPWSTSVSTRSTVPPGTLSSAAAFTFAATSPDSAFSTWPLAPTWPRGLVGSGRCPAGGAPCGAAAAVPLGDDEVDEPDCAAPA